MNTLVTGTFEAQHKAAQAVRKLVKSCVPMDRVRTTSPGTGKRQATYGPIKVAVMAAEYVAQQLAIRILRNYGAHDIECKSAEPRAARSRVRIRVSQRDHHTPVSA